MKPVGSFVKANSGLPKKRRLIMLLYGGQKAGKTHFALSAPGPILLFDFDKGTEGVLQHQTIAKRSDVYIAEYNFAQPTLKKDRGGAEYLDKIRKDCTPVYEKFVEDWAAALKSEARTVVVDTATAMFNLGKLAYVGWSGKVDSKEDPYGQKSGALGAAFGGLITQLYNSDKNVILLAREKAVWEGGEPVPGKYEPTGWSHLPYEVQVVARISKTVLAGETKRKVTIVDSRIDGDFANGLVFSDKEGKNIAGPMTFTSVASMISGTEEETWS